MVWAGLLHLLRQIWCPSEKQPRDKTKQTTDWIRRYAKMNSGSF
jgi:hypothetical protein